MEISNISLQRPYLTVSSSSNDDVIKHMVTNYLYDCLKHTIANDEKKQKKAQEKLKESIR